MRLLQPAGQKLPAGQGNGADIPEKGQYWLMGHTVDAFEPTLGQKLPGAHGEGTDKAAAAHTKPAGQGWGTTAPDSNIKAEADAQQEAGASSG